MSKKKKRKIRTGLRKKYDEPARESDWTRKFQQSQLSEDQNASQRVSGKGRLTRHRTVSGEEVEDETGGFQILLDVDLNECIPARVLRVHGLATIVSDDSGRIFECAVRGLLKTLATDLQHVVVAGDFVQIKPLNEHQAVIVRVEPRRSAVSRTSRGRQQILFSNVDQVLVVCSAAEPRLKPNLVDRFLISCEKSKITPLIIINKVDLVDLADLQPVIGVWGQLGYQVLCTSTVTGFGIHRMIELVCGKDSVVVGQSGVGKSSMLNAIEPGLSLRVGDVSEESQKGKHTTTTANFIPLSIGGHVVDTPGIRQFQLWDVIAQEVEGYFRDIRPFINHCKFPDCRHLHEADCAVKYAVADGKIDERRYESYCQIFQENIRPAGG
ncbi:MAG TPA: ribosome small subunit-dependent GTPase A [Pirellulaceae bacterium]|nr:ribosome small subunit-dependent GTPase A [Pirellulaceae bacterium]HMO92143.1 ribosome small subunit-dependent GTPase A [Pirellulaceae bacterium]HMP68932.1 ribosome small subunit-dependent GTPase A [Pirellulaceae bacterium]